MKKLFGIFALTAIAVLSSVGASAASAATEFGDGCAATTGVPSYTVTTLTAPPGPIPLTAPTDGVITKVKVGFAPASPPPFTIPETVKVLRGAGGNNFTVIQQADVNVGTGTTAADVRMPVKTGDRLGLKGKKFSFEGSEGEITLFCPGGGTLGATTSATNPGDTVEFAEVTSARAPVSATIEPDADNDGYGDETQDKCPQSAATQVACPAVTLSASAAAKKGLASILVTANLQASVTVAGTVKLGKGKSAKLSGGTQIVAPGTLAKFTLLFPKKLREALKALSSKQSLTLKVTATAPNIVGSPTVKTLKLHLKGQGKTKKRSHKKPKAQA